MVEVVFLKNLYHISIMKMNFRFMLKIDKKILEIKMKTFKK